MILSIPYVSRIHEVLALAEVVLKAGDLCEKRCPDAGSLQELAEPVAEPAVCEQSLAHLERSGGYWSSVIS